MLSQLNARARSLWRGIRRGSRVDAEMSEEFRSHMELRADDLVRQGLSRPEAVRQARVEFGSADHYKDRGRESRGLAPFDGLRVSWLDFKLGFRMLGKYPGLTIIGGIAIAFAVAVGAATFEFAVQYLYPSLGLPSGDRIVALQLWDASANRSERRTVRDVMRWRHDLRSIEEIGAFRTVDRNLITAAGAVGDPVVAAEISASTLNLASVRPLLGRSLEAADEAHGAAPVAVLGYDVWQARFGGDAGIVGRSVRLGSTTHTVVGVMPKGFAFPVANGLWLPLHLDELISASAEDRGPPMNGVIGRLRAEASLADARSELANIGLRGAMPRDAYTTVRPRVMPLARATVDVTGEGALMLLSMNTFLFMLLILVFANVALLVFARAATREGEIVVRNALGATRGRIITQLFAEALVLGAFAAIVGIAVGAYAWRRAFAVFGDSQAGGLPFWFHADLSSSTILYVIVLVVVSAIVSGALPALKVTRGIESRLRQAAAGAGGLHFGGVWTAIIVAQIAVTLAFPATAFFVWRDANQVRSLRLGVRPAEYLTARLQMDSERAVDARAGDSRASLAARFSSAIRALEQKAEGDSNVAAVTFATLLPGMDHPQRAIEIAEEARKRDTVDVPTVSSVAVATDYFDALSAPVVAGRGFNAADLDTASRAILVNQAFVRDVLGGRNPIGRRVRYEPRRDEDEDRRREQQPGPWYTVVGVVKDLGMTDGSNPHETGAGLYHPLVPGHDGSVFTAVRVRGGDTRAVGLRLRNAGAAIDATLRLDQMIPLSEISAANLRSTMFVFRTLVLVTGVALLLSLAGIYAVMAFTVARRTREIGVRVALGSDARRIVTTIFARPLKQVAFGVMGGVIIVTALVRLTLETITVVEATAIVGYAVLMLGICLLACIVPTRRALGIQPTEALRADG
jgi:putative ABC transport system permease protein